MKIGCGLLALLAACRGTPPPAPAAQDGWLSFYLRFEPALAAEGRLFVQHESGVELSVATGRDGVELRLPPGPAALRLVVRERQWEQPIVVRRGADLTFDLLK